MIFKKNDRVTTPSGDGVVFEDQQNNEVKVLIQSTNKVELFVEEDIDYDLSPNQA